MMLVLGKKQMGVCTLLERWHVPRSGLVLLKDVGTTSFAYLGAI